MRLFQRARQGAYDARAWTGEETGAGQPGGGAFCLPLRVMTGKRWVLADEGIPRSAVLGAVLLCTQRRNRWPPTLAPKLSQLARLVRVAHRRGVFWNTGQSAIMLALDRTGQGGQGRWRMGERERRRESLKLKMGAWISNRPRPDGRQDVGSGNQASNLNDHCPSLSAK